MEIVVHSKKSLFQEKFQKNLYHFNKNSQFESVMSKNDPIGHPESELGKNPIPTPTVVRNPTLTPPKNLLLLTTPIATPALTLQPCCTCEFYKFLKTYKFNFVSLLPSLVKKVLNIYNV